MAAETKSPKGAATRHLILDAASRLIHLRGLRGYHCTSLEDVLRQSNVGSRENLGYAIIGRLVRSIGALSARRAVS